VEVDKFSNTFVQQRCSVRNITTQLSVVCELSASINK
jgi:hypothetical protein